MSNWNLKSGYPNQSMELSNLNTRLGNMFLMVAYAWTTRDVDPFLNKWAWTYSPCCLEHACQPNNLFPFCKPIDLWLHLPMRGINRKKNAPWMFTHGRIQPQNKCLTSVYPWKDSSRRKMSHKCSVVKEFN